MHTPSPVSFPLEISTLPETSRAGPSGVPFGVSTSRSTYLASASLATSTSPRSNAPISAALSWRTSRKIFQRDGEVSRLIHLQQAVIRLRDFGLDCRQLSQQAWRVADRCDGFGHVGRLRLQF